MILYNLELKVLDSLNRPKWKTHVGLFRTEEHVEHAKTVLEKLYSEDNISFDVYIIDDPFLEIPE